MDADGLRSSLLVDLDEAIELLQSAEELHWLTWLRRDRDRIARGDAYGVDHLLEAFGGMGSFNDLVLSQPNVAGNTADLRRADDRLWDLRDSIWTKCRQLQRDLAD